MKETREGHMEDLKKWKGIGYIYIRNTFLKNKTIPFTMDIE